MIPSGFDQPKFTQWWPAAGYQIICRGFVLSYKTRKIYIQNFDGTSFYNLIYRSIKR